MPDYSAGGLLADQAVLPLNIHRGSTSASMRHADASTETQGDRHTDSVIVEFYPASLHPCVISPNSIALQADYVTVVEDGLVMSTKYCLSAIGLFGQY